MSLPALDLLRPIGLDELQVAADLQDRIDAKYIVPVETVAVLLDRLRATHAVLEIDGLREFRYSSAYFDTPDLRAFRDHLQGRRRRYKCRARAYLDTGICTFEVKLKGVRGRTVKHRMACARPELSAPALAFLHARVQEAYGTVPDQRLEETLAIDYARVTLAAPAPGERVTCDLGLSFAGPDGASARLLPALAIVESKSPRGMANADAVLRALGARPESRCSKYCIGIAATRRGIRANVLRPLLRRHVEPVGAGAPLLPRVAAA